MRNNTVRVVFLKQLDFLFFENKTNNAFVFGKALWFLGESHIPVTCHTLISLQHHVRVWIFEELPTLYIYTQTGRPRAPPNSYYYSHIQPGADVNFQFFEYSCKVMEMEMWIFEIVFFTCKDTRWYEYLDLLKY